MSGLSRRILFENEAFPLSSETVCWSSNMAPLRGGRRVPAPCRSGPARPPENHDLHRCFALYRCAMRRRRAEFFTPYVHKVLVPTLAKGDIVIFDNLGSHQG